MKKFSLSFALVLAVLAGRAALPQPDLIASIHFAGGHNISADRSFPPFADEFSGPEARALANQTLDKLSHAPYSWFKARLAANSGDGSVLLRPLLNDLLDSEWEFEARDMPAGSPEYALAIRLAPARAQVWKNNLQRLLEAWTKIPARAIAGGWELKKDLPPNLIRVTENNGWLLVDCGQNQLTLGETVLDRLAGESAPMSTDEKEWLAADLNWPRLGQWFSDIKALDLPETKLAVSAKDKILRIDGKCFFRENLPLNLPAWQMPANTIHEPLVSFTAARGFSAWLNSQAWARPYAISPMPDQIFIWALPVSPFQTYAAIPVSDSKNALMQSYARLNPALDSANNHKNFLSPLKLAMANDKIQLQGVPFMSPTLQATQGAAGQFLIASGFPDSSRPTMLPPDLLRQLAKKDMVYYHWEITAARFPQLLNMTQLGLVLTRQQQLGTTSKSLNWLKKITPRLGNAVTEITRTAPDELSFARSSACGLTAFELLALGNWLEAKNFPGCDLSLPSPSGSNNQRAVPAAGLAH